MRKTTSTRRLFGLCYALAVILWVVFCLGRCAVMLVNKANGTMPQTTLTAADLRFESFENYQDLEWEDTPCWAYFCQISDSTTSYGSYSGAVPNEKITWGKLDVDTPKFIIESDATIVAPLIFAYLLGW